MSATKLGRMAFVITVNVLKLIPRKSVDFDGFTEFRLVSAKFC